MAAPIVVHPPSPTGGRRVTADGAVLGLAYELRDVEEFLRRAGVDIDTAWVEDTTLIEWRGGGPESWA
ncbi:hypothetical protein RB636_04155 [Streptomyces chrestomyceticus]|uniref:Uncharacterized protein n=1 Tax=Streptomyces chrestomyceticus TaxID=68185 RepID=A0ABU7WLJ9_9ACTN